MNKTCENCINEISGKYCSNCGHPVQLDRVSAKYIVSELGALLFFEKGFLYTIKQLLLSPGQNVRHFILKDRRRLVKPIFFIFLTSLIYTLVNLYFPFEERYMSYSAASSESYVSKIMQWITQNYGYSNLLMSVFIAFWVKVLFKRYKYNFFEILILMCFVIGIAMLLLACAGFFENVLRISLMHYGAIISIIYISWAIAQFFEKRPGNYVRAFCAYMIGMLTFVMSTLIFGVLIDYFLMP